MISPGDTHVTGNKLEHWDQWGIAIGCAIAACISALAAIFDFSTAYLMPFLFAAVYTILRYVARVADGQKELADLRTHVDELRQDFNLAHSSRVEHYPDAASFYKALSDYLAHTTHKHLDTWYMRLETPDDFGASTGAFANYFDNVLSFARSGGSVRRLFCSGTASYSAWVASHRAGTRDLRSYTIREVDWPIKADLMSMAVVGTQVVFLAFTDGDRVQGMRLEDGRAASYFKSYFDRHWENAREVRHPSAP